MSPDTWFLLAGASCLAALAGYGIGWRDGLAYADREESVAINSEGWMGEALEWRALIKAAAMRDMEIPVDEPTIHEDRFA